MSSEPRHGPVTMHRAIERAMLNALRKRPADAPRARPSDEAESAGRTDANARGNAPTPAPRGDRGGRPRVGERGGTSSGDGRRDGA